MAEESGFIQEELYKNSNFVHPRNKKVLYYDCTNYYFEIEQEDELRRYGKSKEHRPNPIVTMGLFMDADGIPLAFDIFPGNRNEQTTLKPLESKIIKTLTVVSLSSARMPDSPVSQTADLTALETVLMSLHNP